MKDSSNKDDKKGGTPLLTGLSKIYISPDTGRLSIPANNYLCKQIDISATIIEESTKDVFSLGLTILGIFANALPDPGQFSELDVFKQIDDLKKLGSPDLSENSDLDIEPLQSSGVLRAIKLPEKQLLSITLQKPFIKALKVLCIQLELEANQVLTLSAQLVQAILGTIDYMDMTQKQIYQAIAAQIEFLCKKIA